MRREVIDCDCCGAKNVTGAQLIQVRVGRQWDGVETDSVYESLDLCPKCLGIQLFIVVEKAGEDFCKAWVNAIRKK